MHKKRPGAGGAFVLATLLAALPLTAACERKSDAPANPEPIGSTATCSKRLPTTVYPQTGRVVTGEFCHEAPLSTVSMAITVWDFSNLQQVCQGLQYNGGYGPVPAIGGCKSIFDASVNGGEREYHLGTLNIERKKIGLPDLDPQRPVP
jgi:hypothetical protein